MFYLLTKYYKIKLSIFVLLESQIFFNLLKIINIYIYINIKIILFHKFYYIKY